MKSFAKILALACILAPGAVYSAATCGVSTTSVVFPGYDVFVLTPNDSTGTITVTCDWPPPSPPTVPPTVTISIGASPISGGVNPRKMKHSSKSDLLNYNFFTDAARSAIWGDGTQGTSTVSKKVNKNKPWVSTVYGRVPARQNVPVGLYSDTLTVTIMW